MHGIGAGAVARVARTSRRWSRVFVGDGRCLVYGPAWGRLYLLPAAQSLDPVTQTIFGLRSFALDDGAGDPAAAIVHDRSSAGRTTLHPAATRRVTLLYRVLHRLRSVVPVWLAAVVVVWVARRSSRCSRSVSEIGRIVHAVESLVGVAECYPRALLTCFLSVTSGHACELTVGVLAPTRKMHAWCTTGGQLPYEALPEHYLYRPLMILGFDA
jgi:hypothetical protein